MHPPGSCNGTPPNSKNVSCSNQSGSCATEASHSSRTLTPPAPTATAPQATIGSLQSALSACGPSVVPPSTPRCTLATSAALRAAASIGVSRGSPTQLQGPRGATCSRAAGNAEEASACGTAGVLSSCTQPSRTACTAAVYMPSDPNPSPAACTATACTASEAAEQGRACHSASIAASASISLPTEGLCEGSKPATALPEGLAAAAMEIWEQCKACATWQPLDKSTGAPSCWWCM